MRPCPSYIDTLVRGAVVALTLSTLIQAIAVNLPHVSTPRQPACQSEVARPSK